MQQCLTLDDDVARIMRHELQDKRAESSTDSSVQLDCPGLAQLLPIPVEQPDVSEAWKEAKRLLQKMTRLGLTRIKDILDGHNI